MRVIWRVDYTRIAEELLEMIPNKLKGRLLDILISPHYTKESAINKLTELFGDRLETKQCGPVLIFKGIK